MKEKVEEIENFIRSHQITKAQEQLLGITMASIPRPFLAKVAQLGIRAGIPLWSFRLLKNVMKFEVEGIQASSEEKLEYAFALIKLGAQHEAYKVLEELNQAAGLPKVHFYLGAIQVSRWNYEEALKSFNKYLNSTGLTSYEKVIGEINQVSCMIAAEQDLDQAEVKLENLEKTLSASENQTLYGNSIELMVQLKLKLKKYDEGMTWIKKGQSVFQDPNSIYSLFFKKWKALLELAQNPSHVGETLNKVMAEAKRLQHFETLRDCEYHMALITENEELFNKVYFGTPWLAYRERMKKKKPNSINMHERFKWILGFAQEGEALKTPMVFVDRLEARIQGQKMQLKSGQVPHRLLCALTSDFYRPVSVAAVFSFLFPDEFYHPESGPKRVHQAIFRLRKWFEKGNLPIEIKEENGSYYLSASQAVAFSISLQNASGPAQGLEAVCQKLLQIFEDQEFGAQEAAQSLSISPTRARQALRWGVDHKVIVKTGRGPQTKYKKSA